MISSKSQKETGKMKMPLASTFAIKTQDFHQIHTFLSSKSSSGFKWRFPFCLLYNLSFFFSGSQHFILRLTAENSVLSTFMEESLRPDPTKLAFNVLKELRSFYNLSHLWSLVFKTYWKTNFFKLKRKKLKDSSKQFLFWVSKAGYLIFFFLHSCYENPNTPWSK